EGNWISDNPLSEAVILPVEETKNIPGYNKLDDSSFFSINDLIIDYYTLHNKKKLLEDTKSNNSSDLMKLVINFLTEDYEGGMIVGKEMNHDNVYFNLHKSNDEKSLDEITFETYKGFNGYGSKLKKNLGDMYEEVV